MFNILTFQKLASAHIWRLNWWMTSKQPWIWSLTINNQNGVKYGREKWKFLFQNFILLKNKMFQMFSPVHELIIRFLLKQPVLLQRWHQLYIHIYLIHTVALALCPTCGLSSGQPGWSDAEGQEEEQPEQAPESRHSSEWRGEAQSSEARLRQHPPFACCPAERRPLMPQEAIQQLPAADLQHKDKHEGNS